MNLKNLDILVGLDARETAEWLIEPEFSPASIRALQAAVTLVSGGKGRLTLMFTGAVASGLAGLTGLGLAPIADPEVLSRSLRTAWRERLAALAWQEIPQEIPHRLIVGARSPAVEILDQLASGEHGLAALGGSTRSVLAQEVLGSVTERVLRETVVPALVAGLEPQHRSLSTAPEILVCLDLSESARRALRLAVSMVRAHGGGLTLLSVDPIPAIASPAYADNELNPLRRQLLDWSRGRARVLRGRVEKLASEEIPDGVPYEVVVREGSPSAAILDQVELGDFDLVSLGVTGHSNHAPGTTARRVMRSSKTPMLLAP